MCFIDNVSGTITVVGTQIRPQDSVYTTISLSDMLVQAISLQEQSIIAHPQEQSHYTFCIKIARSAETAVLLEFTKIKAYLLGIFDQRQQVYYLVL